MPFHRLKVRLKREIVTMGEPVDPLGGVGTYVTPVDWNALIDQPGTLIIDTRNDYEVRVGSFAGAVDPHTESFSDFPAWFREHREQIAAATRVKRVDRDFGVLPIDGDVRAFDEDFAAAGSGLTVTTDIAAASDCTAYVICVPTPVADEV